MSEVRMPTPAENRDMLELRVKAQGWIDSLQIAGMSEAAIVSAIQLSLIERALVAGGVDQTIGMLQGWIRLVGQNGEALLAELRKSRT